MRAGRLPHEVGRPHQEDRAGDGRRWLADRRRPTARRGPRQPPWATGVTRIAQTLDDMATNGTPSRTSNVPPSPAPVEGTHVSFGTWRTSSPTPPRPRPGRRRRGVDDDAQNQAGDGRNGDDGPRPRRLRSPRAFRRCPSPACRPGSPTADRATRRGRSARSQLGNGFDDAGQRSSSFARGRAVRLGSNHMAEGELVHTGEPRAPTPELSIRAALA